MTHFRKNYDNKTLIVGNNVIFDPISNPDWLIKD